MARTTEMAVDDMKAAAYHGSDRALALLAEAAAAEPSDRQVEAKAALVWLGERDGVGGSMPSERAEKAIAAVALALETRASEIPRMPESVVDFIDAATLYRFVDDTERAAACTEAAKANCVPF